MLCWFHKIMISHALDGERQLHKLTEKHIRRCTTCGEFYDACLSLSEGLIREVMSLERPVSKRLSTRISTALSRRQPAITSPPTRWRPTAVAACIGLMALAAVFFLPRRPDEQHPNKYDDAVKAVNAIISSADNLTGGRLPKADSTATWSGLIERPLQGEMRKLADDTESAVRFLVVCMRVDVTATKGKSIN